MVIHYDPGLVILSVLVAIFASYTALVLAESVTRASGRKRGLWLAIGSIAMGLGIWSMHFIGMLAFSMPGMEMGYDLGLMLLSILIAIFASALALHVVGSRDGKVRSYSFAGLAMGIAIAGMHYTGMASMRMAARIEWNYWLVAASVAIAIVASFGALWIAFRLRRETGLHPQLARAVGATVMGIAISGMHYTGMAAASFVHSGEQVSGEEIIADSKLTAFVTVTTLLILGFAVYGSIVERVLGRRKEMMDASAQALASAEEERELRERFVSSLTHDLRTPLAAAKLSAQLLIRHQQNLEKTHELSAKIVESLERADQMIRDLLDAHRIGAHQPLPLRIEECDLAALVRETIEEMSPVHGNRFVLIGSSALKGWWDSGYLRRLIENLASNAVKYGFSHTPVTVQCAETGAGNVRLSVHNEGEPLSESEQANLFLLFHRLKSAQSSGAKGWGIGLTLVKGVAESHGGTVVVRSARESGTTFVVNLPIDARPFISVLSES